jgi:hypothetical protein
MTDPPSPQRGLPTLTKPKLSDSNKNLVSAPRWGSTPRLTSRLTLGRNVNLTLTLTLTQLAESQFPS